MNRPSRLWMTLAPALAVCLLLVTACAPHRAATTRHKSPKTHSPLSSPPLSRPATQPASTQPASTQPAAARSAALPFAAEIEAFEKSDRTSPPPQGAVLFVGSSSIRLWKTLQEDFAGLTVINRGFGGSQVADSVRYADRIVLPYRPKVIVLYAGDNDLAAGKPPQQVLADFAAFETRVHAALPRTPVLYLAIKPSVARWNLITKIRQANRLIEDFAKDSKGKVVYVDTFAPILGPDGQPRRDLLQSDGLHLNAEGYRLWTPVVRDAIDRALGTN